MLTLHSYYTSISQDFKCVDDIKVNQALHSTLKTRIYFNLKDAIIVYFFNIQTQTKFTHATRTYIHNNTPLIRIARFHRNKLLLH